MGETLFSEKVGSRPRGKFTHYLAELVLSSSFLWVLKLIASLLLISNWSRDDPDLQDNDTINRNFWLGPLKNLLLSG